MVDDDPGIRHALKRVLRREGYDFFEADGSEAALAVLSKQPIEVVLSDHRMPGMTGLELLTLVRDRFPDTIRIILTGHADLAVAIQAINQGEIYRFLTKPWDEVELKVTLFLALERQRLAATNRRLLGLLQQNQEALAGLVEKGPAPDPRIAEALRLTEAELKRSLGDQSTKAINTLPPGPGK